MSRYKGQLHGGKKAKKFGQGPPPPTFRAMLQRKGCFLCEVFPNCDYNFGTFDNFGVKNDQKVSHNMILMSRHMGQLHGGRGPKNSGKAFPPFSGNERKENVFFL